MEVKTTRVLLIEDNTDDLELIKRKLSRSTNNRYIVTTAKKLKTGLECLASEDVDLILSDLGLPDSHGLDTVTKLLCGAPHVPLIILSGFDDEAIAIKAVQAGAQDYLVKGQIEDSQIERSLSYAIERARLQNELEQNTQEICSIQENLYKILENNADAIVVVGTDKCILFANPAVESLLGRKQDELINKPFDFPLGKGKKSEIEITRPGNGKTIAEMNVVEIDWEGRPAYLASLRDITERKHAEEAIRESEIKFSKAFHTSANLFAINKLSDGNFIEVNDAFTRMTGYMREEVLGRNATELNIWADKETHTRIVKKTRENQRIRNEEIVIRHKSGEIITGLYASEPLIIGGEECYLHTLTDITEKKQSQEILQTVSHGSPLGIYIMQDDRLQYTNPQFQKITGYSKKELAGRELLSLIAVEDSDVVRSSTVFTIQEKNPYPCEYRILNKTGRIKWVMQTVTPIHYEGRDAILGNLMDITERKYLERKITEYEELSKMKSNLLATVSHELRTPLATIKGYSTMILDYYARLASGEIKDYLASIDNSADRLAKLVDNLLDTSRMEAGLLKLERSATDINILIKTVAAEASIRDSNHRISTELNAELPKVNIDAKRIRQVLDNLIDNAIKYSPQGTQVLISAKKNGREVLISINDQGAGIPAGELTSIFDRMYRIEQRLSPGQDGIGLGLYICQGLVEAHGGRIWAESTVGEGSTIQFTLPLAGAGKGQ